MTYTIHLGSNLDILPTLPDNSVDSIVTDPPYGLSDNKYVADTIARWIGGERDFIPDGKGFMGKAWDSFVPPPALWDECLRVLKPGGHLLAFFGSRTQDIGALSIRLAGFEIRDSIAWMYGSGFPKSLDVSKAIDKAAGADRNQVLPQGATKCADYPNACSGHNETGKFSPTVHALPTAPSTPQAQQWEGWGTALKPAHEPIVVARKPLIGTVAETVLEHGTGGLNIDGSRIVHDDAVNLSAVQKDFSGMGYQGTTAETAAVSTYKASGRWPSNVILDPYTAELLDEQSGVSKSTTNYGGQSKTKRTSMGGGEMYSAPSLHNDLGGASRFFYVAKASKRDRNEGLDDLEPTRHSDRENADGVGGDNPRNRSNEARQNFHPTVKPTDLMRYLVKLVTPPGGVVLDPFTGSGSTGKAAILEGFDFIGIELTEEYLPIIEGRLKHAEQLVAERKEKEDEALF